MKKKQTNNTQQLKGLQYLQKKYDEQKQILQLKIKSLQLQIHKQIEKNYEEKLNFQKRQQHFSAERQKLQHQIQSLSNKLLIASQEKQPDQQDSQEQLNLLKKQKQIMMENISLKQQLRQHSEIISQLQQELKQQQKKIQELSLTVQQQDNIITHIKQQINHLQSKKDQLLHESKLLAIELQRKNQHQHQLTQQNLKYQNKLSINKKKKKQMEKSLEDMQEKIKLLQAVQMMKSMQEISELKQQKQKIQQKNIQLQTKLQFFAIEINQKNNYIEKVQIEIHQLQTNCQNLQREFHRKLENLQFQNKQLKNAMEQEQINHENQIDQMKTKYNEEVCQLKKKIIEQVYQILRTKQLNNPKSLENLIQGLRSSKSYSNIPKNYITHRQTTQPDFFQKYKYETHLSNLQNQLQTNKKQNEYCNNEINRYKKLQEEYKNQLEHKTRVVAQLTEKIQKKQKYYNQEITQLQNQIGLLKSKQTELLEIKRQSTQYQRIIAMKISSYDKKIGQLLEDIERKQQFMQKIKHNKLIQQQKNRAIEEKFVKVLQEVDSLRKWKQDTTRKDQLVKQYKIKLQKLKTQNDHIKQHYENLKKQKSRIQKNLQAKQQYVNSLKIKLQKLENQIQSKQRDIKGIRDKQHKSISLDKDKSKKLKKQNLSYVHTMQQFREIIIEKVQQIVAKSIPQQKKKKQQWQAAKLLGLKNSEIEEFINPLAGIDKSILKDLDNLWNMKNYIEFFETSLQYLILKK